MRRTAEGVVVALLMLACGSLRSGPQAVEQSSSALCSSSWNPTWRQANANEWWVEYVITGGTVQAAWLEVGTRRVNLSPQWGKWGGSTPRIPTGTSVVLHAQNAVGEAAQTLSFGYLVTTQPTTDWCEADAGASSVDAGTGSADAGTSPADAGTSPADAGTSSTDAGASTADAGCVSTWAPTWQQANANNWWIDYVIGGGTARTVWLETLDGRRANLSEQWGKWSGSAPGKIETGAQVVLHATDTAGHAAQTVPFGYLTTAQPATDTCGAPPPPPCTGFDAGMVSISMDDGWASQHTFARPELVAHGMRSTVYLITDRVGAGWTGYLTLPQAQDLKADGNEIASHTVNHLDLTTLSDAEIDDQLRLSQQWLATNLGVTATDFASPYGAYDDRVLTAARRYYDSHVTVTAGLNFRGGDLYQLRRAGVLSSTTTGDIHALITDAQSRRGWLILMFHEFTSGTPSNPYMYRASDFKTVLDDLRASGLEVVTVKEGVARMRCP